MQYVCTASERSGGCTRHGQGRHLPIFERLHQEGSKKILSDTYRQNVAGGGPKYLMIHQGHGHGSGANRNLLPSTFQLHVDPGSACTLTHVRLSKDRTLRYAAVRLDAGAGLHTHICSCRCLLARQYVADTMWDSFQAFL